MVQLLFGLISDSAIPSKMGDFFREMFAVFDKVIYSLIGFTYNVLFNIADSNIIDPDIIKEFYGRVQLILGVIMIFKVSVSLMQYVINPDAFADKKTGFGQIITRIVTMLAMLTAIVPLNIPSSDTEKNSYNSYLNQHGLLFGTLYSLQHRILTGNTIGKLVLGSNSNTITTTDDNNEDKSTVKYSGDSSTGNEIASTILKSFISINYKEKQPTTEEEGESDDSYVCAPSATTSKNYVHAAKNIYVSSLMFSTFMPFMPLAAAYSLRNLIDTAKELLSTSFVAYYYDAWLKTSDPSVISDMVTIKCSNGYAFAYLPIASTICGIILLITLAASCLDVAIRALKLAVLRLLAPIAIISYIDPKSAEKGAFGSWVKMVISTYLELFLRLAILYFVIFLVDGILHGGLDLPYTGGTVGVFSTILIIIGLFYFARQAPKFITDALGIKSLGMGVGISGLLGAVGSFMGGGGLTGAAAGFMDASNASADAAAQGKQAPPAYSSQRDKVAQMLTGDKNARGGILGTATKAMQDRANANLAERAFGINRNKVAAAKDLKYALAGEAADAKNKYERFVNGHMTDLERNSLINDYARQEAMNQDGWSELSEAEQNDRINSYVNGLSNLSTDQQNSILSTYLEDDCSSKETASAKQNAWYEEGAKMLEAMGINETLQEKYSARGRGRARRTYDQNLVPRGTDRNYKINHSVRPKTTIDRRSDIERLNQNNNP